ncbi:MAG: undecaprenyl-diphosphate phosphatase [Nitrospirae bacterium]|nr:undecaprenyl-diphosphate phosphatase [Nitrospirota bacterium]
MDLEIIKAIILGLTQGLTEFIPISSTAHLILIPWIFGWNGDVNTMSFDIALHAGTLLALLACFYKEWIDLLLKKRNMLLLLIVATIPAAIVGALLDHYVERTLRSPLIISISLVVIGIVMYISEKRFKTSRSFDEITLKDAVIIGISQALAIIPGVSRSGITISSGLTRGINRGDSARFSFLLSTPIVAGAVLLHGVSILKGHHEIDIRLFSSGVIASFVSGIISIKFLLQFFKKHSMMVFVYYRIVLAVIIVAGLWVKG